MVKPGDPILKHLTANWFNNVTNAANRNLGQFASHQNFSRLEVTVVNHQAVAKDIYDAVAISDASIDYDTTKVGTLSQLAFETQALSNTDPHNWAILQAPLQGKIGATAPALLSGITWANVVTSDPNQSLTATVLGLAIAPVGKAFILFENSGAGPEVLIQIGIPQTRSDYFFELTEDMAAETLLGTYITASATANFYDVYGTFAFTETLYSWLGLIDEATTGYRGSAKLQDDLWIFDQGPCLDEIISS